MMNRQMIRPAVLLLLILVSAGTPSSWAETCGRFCSAENISILAGETRNGDTYFFTQDINVAGSTDGDLIGMAQSGFISGRVDGDIIFFGQSLDITGEVLDSVRFWGNVLHVRGSIDGDLLLMGGTFSLHPGAVVTGNLIGTGGSFLISGTVEEDLHFTGGKITIAGRILGDVKVTADEISLGPEAEILGNLTYTARKELTLENSSNVKGEIIFKQAVKKEDSEEDEPWITTWGFIIWCWKAFGCMLIGFVALALARRCAPTVLVPIDRDPMLSALIGFGTFLMVPAASLLAIFLIISLPLGLITLMLFLAAAYLAKIPIAIWIGRRLLSLLGFASPSPYLALVIGTLLLYLLFTIPFYVGWLTWLATTWLGLGSLILAVKSNIEQRNEA